MATDPGGESTTLNVTIEILNINEHKPYFLLRTTFLTIQDNLARFTTIGELEAVDGDTEPYSIKKCYIAKDYDPWKNFFSFNVRNLETENGGSKAACLVKVNESIKGL